MQRKNKMYKYLLLFILICSCAHITSSLECYKCSNCKNDYSRIIEKCQDEDEKCMVSYII